MITEQIDLMGWVFKQIPYLIYANANLTFVIQSKKYETGYIGVWRSSG